MKILVLSLDHADPELLFGLDDLPNLQRLMELGAYGRIEPSDAPIPSASWVRLMDHYSQDAFQLVDLGKHRVGQDSPDAPIDPGRTDSETEHVYYVQIDEGIGQALETLTEETVVLVVAAPTAQGPGAFILAGPGSPLNGEIEGVHFEDLEPTLLQLGGHDIPAALTGRSLLTENRTHPEKQGQVPMTDEELIRERLSGLGYI